MATTASWQASLTEQRTACGVAVCCVVLVFLASAQPEWFDLSRPQQSPQQPAVQKQTIQKAVVQTPPVTQPAPRITPHAAPTPKHKQQVATKVKSSAPQPKPKKMPAIPPHPVTDTASIAAGFYVQVGAFQHPHARGLADRLKKDGWKTVISARKNGLYAVWIGPKKTRASAEKLSKTVQRKLKIKGFIIHQKSV